MALSELGSHFLERRWHVLMRGGDDQAPAVAWVLHALRALRIRRCLHHRTPAEVSNWPGNPRRASVVAVRVRLWSRLALPLLNGRTGQLPVLAHSLRRALAVRTPLDRF